MKFILLCTLILLPSIVHCRPLVRLPRLVDTRSKSTTEEPGNDEAGDQVDGCAIIPYDRVYSGPRDCLCTCLGDGPCSCICREDQEINPTDSDSYTVKFRDGCQCGSRREHGTSDQCAYRCEHQIGLQLPFTLGNQNESSSDTELVNTSHEFGDVDTDEESVCQDGIDESSQHLRERAQMAAEYFPEGMPKTRLKAVLRRALELLESKKSAKRCKRDDPD